MLDRFYERGDVLAANSTMIPKLTDKDRALAASYVKQKCGQDSGTMLDILGLQEWAGHES